jgi:hypothetical protein
MLSNQQAKLAAAPCEPSRRQRSRESCWRPAAKVQTSPVRARPCGCSDARATHTATALGDGSVLALGGADDDEHGSQLRSAKLYGPRARRWSPAESMAQARCKITGAVALLRDGRVLIAGGATIEVFDPSRVASPRCGTRAPAGCSPPRPVCATAAP